MGWVWGGIVIGIVIVALAVGIPYFYTHKRMREPRDLSDSRAYLAAKRRGRWQRRAQAQPGQAPEGTESR